MRITPRWVWAAGLPGDTPPTIDLPAPDVWLHHGAGGSSTVQTARSYLKYHTRSRGYLDIGYSFLVAEGEVLEGRGAGRQGAHTRSQNSSSHGICMVGEYTHSLPAQEDLDALIWLLRHGADEGWWPTPVLSGGHTDAPGASTTCPGAALHAHIPHINRLAGNPHLAAKEDDVALTNEQERALAMIPRLVADVETIKSRIPANTGDELDRLRVGVRRLAEHADLDLGDEGP